MTPVISRAEARAQGLKRYFTGKPCPQGHLTERLVSMEKCLECIQIEQRAKYQTNKERILKRMAARYQANKERIQARCREYARANLDGYITRARARKQDIRDRLVILTSHEQAQVRAIYRARYRLTQDTGIPYHVDHHLPLALGGLHHPENLRLLPGHINDAKGAKHPDEFYAQVGSVLP